MQLQMQNERVSQGYSGNRLGQAQNAKAGGRDLLAPGILPEQRQSKNLDEPWDTGFDEVPYMMIVAMDSQYNRQ